MSITAAEVKFFNQLRIVMYAFNVPLLAIWIGILGRVLVSKDRRELTEVIVISSLMSLNLAGDIVEGQINYTYEDRAYKGDLNRPKLWNWIIDACGFTLETAFYLAHWIFAFSYLALSYRLELASKDQRENAYNCRLNTVNAIVCLIIIAINAAYEIFYTEEDYIAKGIFFDIASLTLVASSTVLVWAIYRLYRISK